MSSRNVNTTFVFMFFVLCFQMNVASAEENSADQLYEAAFKLIIEGSYGEAYDRLDEIIAKYPNTPYARLAENRKQRLEKLNLLSIRRKKINQSGRIESVVFSTLYSTWLGVGIARLANAKSEKAIAAGMMIGAPVGLLTSLALTRNAKLSKGQASLINFSGYWGTWQGYGLATLLDENDDEKTMISSAMAGGLLGILTTSALTRKVDISLGDAGIINYGGLWGTWLSLCIGIIFDVKDSDNFLSLVLAGGNLGVTAMAILSPEIEISLARASLINLGGIVGTIVAGGSLLITKPEDEESAFATLMAGGILGLVAGGYSTQGFDAQGVFQKLGHIGTGLKPACTWTVNNQHHKISSKEVRANLLSIQF